MNIDFFNKKLTFGTFVVLFIMFFTSCVSTYQTSSIDDDIYYSKHDNVEIAGYQEYTGIEEQNEMNEYDQKQYENEKRQETNRRVLNTIGHILLWSFCWVEIIF